MFWKLNTQITKPKFVKKSLQRGFFNISSLKFPRIIQFCKSLQFDVIKKSFWPCEILRESYLAGKICDVLIEPNNNQLVIAPYIHPSLV
jgi:hypothetical protein